MSNKNIAKRNLIPGDAGRIVRAVRVRLGIKQKEFSALMGVRQAGLSEIENGKKRPSQAFWAHFKYRYLDKSNLGPETTQKKQSSNVIEIEHSNLIKQFKDKALAKAINESLVRLENVNEAKFRNLGSYIMMLEQLESNPLSEKSAGNPTTLSSDDLREKMFRIMQETMMHRLEILESKVQELQRQEKPTDDKEESAKKKVL